MPKKPLNDNVGDLFYAAAQMIQEGRYEFACFAAEDARGFTDVCRQAAKERIRADLGNYGVFPNSRVGREYTPPEYTGNPDPEMEIRYARVEWLLNLSAQHGGPGARGIAE